MGRRPGHPGVRRAAATLVAVVLAGTAGFGAATAVGATTAQEAQEPPPTTGTSAPEPTIPGPTTPGPAVTSPSTTIAPPGTGTAVPPTTGTSTPGPTAPTTGTSVPGPTIPPSTTTTVPSLPDDRAVTVTPTTGLQPGDSITVTGTGFLPGSLVGVSGCTEAARGLLGLPSAACDVLLDLVTTAPDGTFTSDIVVGTPAYELVHVLEAADDPRPLLVEIDVAAPAAPEVRMRLTSDEVQTGEALYAQGWAWPADLAAGALSTTCADVPETASDRAAVEAACGPLDEMPAPSTSPTGRLFVAAGVEEGDEALWVGVPLDDGTLVGQAVPFTALPPPDPFAVTVTPAEDLVDGQAVAISGSGADTAVGWPGAWVTQCAGAVLDDGRMSLIEFYALCDDGQPQAPLTVDPNGTFSGQLVVDRLLSTQTGVVRCDLAPGDCAVVVYAPYTEPYYLSGGTPIAFRPVPPVVAPQAARVTEGDDGATAVEVPVRLDRPSATPVTVEWTTFDWPPLPWAATYGEDATAASGTLTVAPGEVEATVTVEVLGDTAAEGEEMALFGLTAVDGGTVGGFAGIGGVVIDDDD